jgi:hypothetical protein
MTTRMRTIAAAVESRTNPTPVDRLRELWDPTGCLLSVFITVPPDPAALREFPARLDRLLATARPVGVDAGAGRRVQAARAAVRETGVARAREWFGRTVAIVASGDGGVLEEMRLPCVVPDRAVFGRRPYLRPLVRAKQACRPYSVVVIDRRQAWLFEISGDAIHRVRRLEGESTRGHTHAGWYGLEEYRDRHHQAELAHRHYEAAAAALQELAPADGYSLVVGGHKDGVEEFLTSLPVPLRDRVAGTFAVDPHTMTPHVVHTRAAAVMAERETTRQQRVADDLAKWEAAGLAVSGVERCAEMVSKSLADLLVVRGDDPVPGSVCDQCGGLTMDLYHCRNCKTVAHPVFDVIDEMVARMLDTGGKIDLGSREHVGFSVAARLRHTALAHGGRQPAPNDTDAEPPRSA